MKKETFYMFAGVGLFILGCGLNAIIFVSHTTIDKWVAIAMGLPFIGAALLVRPDVLDKAVAKLPFVKSGE